MKPQEKKVEFINLRAEGKSYRDIAKALNINKNTAMKWDKELNDKITELKQEQLDELYNSYAMTKEARIKRLGDTLENINKALEGADLKELPPEKLLDFKLKYTEALKEEYTGSGKPYKFNDSIEPTDIITALSDLLNRIRAGDVSSEQAAKESTVITNLLKAYDTAELKTKLDKLEAIIGGQEQCNE